MVDQPTGKAFSERIRVQRRVTPLAARTGNECIEILRQNRDKGRPAVDIVGKVPILYISLPAAVARRERLVESARANGITATWVVGERPDICSDSYDDKKRVLIGPEGLVLRFAVDGDDYSLTVPAEHSGTVTLGQIGCSLSHIKAMIVD